MKIMLNLNKLFTIYFYYFYHKVLCGKLLNFDLANKFILVRILVRRNLFYIYKKELRKNIDQVASLENFRLNLKLFYILFPATAYATCQKKYIFESINKSLLLFSLFSIIYFKKFFLNFYLFKKNDTSLLLFKIISYSFTDSTYNKLKYRIAILFLILSKIQVKQTVKYYYGYLTSKIEKFFEDKKYSANIKKLAFLLNLELKLRFDMTSKLILHNLCLLNLIGMRQVILTKLKYAYKNSNINSRVKVITHLYFLAITILILLNIKSAYKNFLLSGSENIIPFINLYKYNRYIKMILFSKISYYYNASQKKTLNLTFNKFSLFNIAKKKPNELYRNPLLNSDKPLKIKK